MIYYTREEAQRKIAEIVAVQNAAAAEYYTRQEAQEKIAAITETVYYTREEAQRVIAAAMPFDWGIIPQALCVLFIIGMVTAK